MLPEHFCIWLQGFVEMRKPSELPTKEQWKLIQDHLKAVFTKVTPELGAKAKPAKDKETTDEALRRLRPSSVDTRVYCSPSRPLLIC